MSLGERRRQIVEAGEALRGLASVLWEGGEVDSVMTELDDLVRWAEAAQVGVLAEALQRGEAGPISASVAGSGARRWVQEHVPHQVVTGRVGCLVAVVRGLHPVPGERLRPERESLVAAVTNGTVGVSAARVVLGEVERLEHRVAEETVAGLWASYADVAAAGATARQIRALRPRMLAQYGEADELDRDREAAARFVRLSQPVQDGALWRYELTLDDEGRAVLEAAIGPASAPQPLDGAPDLRSGEQRRGHAFVDLLRRAVTVGSPGGGSHPATTLLVTMDVRDLRGRLGPPARTGGGRGGHGLGGEAGQDPGGGCDADRAEAVPRPTVGAGTVLGSVAAGTLIPAGRLRRLACDAAVIPAVLGASGELLDLGRERRLFSTPQRRELWRRDGGCTMPGCSTPGAWADAHHLWHWIDGGPTDLTNAALLCGRHHTLVHQQELRGWVDEASNRVMWDTAPGSYAAGVQRRRGAG